MHSNAIMYCFLNVQRDSANQYKYSEVSQLMLENKRGTEPGCFESVLGDRAVAVVVREFPLEADEGQSKPPASVPLRALQQRACSQLGAFHQKHSK